MMKQLHLYPLSHIESIHQAYFALSEKMVEVLNKQGKASFIYKAFFLDFELEIYPAHKSIQANLKKFIGACNTQKNASALMDFNNYHQVSW